MGRKRTYFSDKFKIEVTEKAPKKRSKETVVAAKYNIFPSSFPEWMELFLEGKHETGEQKAPVKKMKNLGRSRMKCLLR